jgi:hypothetical protein
VKIYYDNYKYISIEIFEKISYLERCRDWPDETSATTSFLYGANSNRAQLWEIRREVFIQKRSLLK